MTGRKNGFADRAAYALPETAATVGIGAVLIALLAVAAHESQRVAGLSATMANYRQLAAATADYAADHRDRFWTFSWRPGPDGTVSQFPDLNSHLDDDPNRGRSWMRAAANQAIDIIRRRTGDDNFPVNTSWIPHFQYGHLVLAEYRQDPLLSPFTLSRNDFPRELWRRAYEQDPTGAAFFALDRRPSGTAPSLLRWAFSSSYWLVPSAFSRDAHDTVDGTTLEQASTHNGFSVGLSRLGDRTRSQVAFPSHKVLVNDQFQRYFGSRYPFFAYEEARLPVLMADGSAAVRATQEAGRGFRPNRPRLVLPTVFKYQPDTAWEPPTLSSLRSGSDSVFGHYRWTRGGLQGRDFEGPEIDTSGW